MRRIYQFDHSYYEDIFISLSSVLSETRSLISLEKSKKLKDLGWKVCQENATMLPRGQISGHEEMSNMSLVCEGGYQITCDFTTENEEGWRESNTREC
jgi:hypothetical protein